MNDDALPPRACWPILGTFPGRRCQTAMTDPSPPATPLRRLVFRVGLLLAVLAAGVAYRLYLGRSTVRAVRDGVARLTDHVIEPNDLAVGEPFTVGLKPEWWHDQWVVIPTRTPAHKTVILRFFVHHTWSGAAVTLAELQCNGHDPCATEELSRFTVEREPAGLTVKSIPPDVLLARGPVDLKRWIPGSFEDEPPDLRPADEAAANDGRP
jgi:hypothetical protein